MNFFGVFVQLTVTHGDDPRKACLYYDATSLGPADSHRGPTCPAPSYTEFKTEGFSSDWAGFLKEMKALGGCEGSHLLCHYQENWTKEREEQSRYAERRRNKRQESVVKVYDGFLGPTSWPFLENAAASMLLGHRCV